MIENETCGEMVCCGCICRFFVKRKLLLWKDQWSIPFEEVVGVEEEEMGFLEWLWWRCIVGEWKVLGCGVLCRF